MDQLRSGVVSRRVTTTPPIERIRKQPSIRPPEFTEDREVIGPLDRRQFCQAHSFCDLPVQIDRVQDKCRQLTWVVGNGELTSARRKTERR
jgi:hypothetical protein